MENPKEEKNIVEEKATPKEGKVYNFTKHSFVVVAKNREEAEEALKEFLAGSKNKKNKENKK